MSQQLLCPTMNVSRLSSGQRLLILRRRKGISQRQAAAQYGVSLYKYRHWETDVEQAPLVSVGRLADYEEFVIRRVLDGASVLELAEEMGITRTWRCRMEFGKAPLERLAEWWDQADKPWRPRGR